VKIVAASDSSVLVTFGDVPSPETEDLVLGLFHALKARHDVRILNLHPGYVSLLIDFDPLAMSHDKAAGLVKSLLDAGAPAIPGGARLVEVPVCYGADFGPDLADVASHTGVLPDEVVRLHSRTDCRVAFLGFTAGFAYLSGMPEALSTPRLATPRRTVPAGSIGIAGRQTGIYPAETPGGWRLIGRTPLRMFDASANQPARLEPGDRVRFVRITRAEFDRLWRERAL
jgi:KipI family sensor histidine kinase inhibitor